MTTTTADRDPEWLLRERFGLVEFRPASGRSSTPCLPPAFTQARLSRQPLFGILEEQRLADVLDWRQRQGSKSLAREMLLVSPGR